jgi:hypothetical protein
MAYSKTIRKNKNRRKKGGVQTRGQKRRIEEGLPIVETDMKEAPVKKTTTKALNDTEILSELKPKTKKPTTKRPTTKKERKEAREKLPSVIKQKQEALKKKLTKLQSLTKLTKKKHNNAIKGIKLRRFKKFQESRKKTPKMKSKFAKTFRKIKHRLSPIKESPKTSSPHEYKSTVDKEILSGLEKSLRGLKINN